MTELGTGPEDQPLPGGGWSEQILTLQDACVVPPVESALVQQAGVLKADGSYCPEAALWRKFRPITIAPDQPEEIKETISGRWLWGGVLWVHFGHFLVESSSRLWALAHLDQPVDGILFIPKRPSVGDETHGYQHEFIDLFAPGLPIRVVAEPSRVEELVVPGQGFGLGQITQGTRKFRNAVHSRFARDVKPEGPEKIYISRSKLGLGKGGLLGEEQMEERLHAEGYEIFHPQDHSLSEQLARYKAAKQVIAADGSAIHLYAMVGRPDQKVAIVLRRRSGAHNLLAANVAHFCKCTPLVIGGLRTEWVPKDKPKSSRNSFGEIDHSLIGRALAQHGFISHDAKWPVLSDEERSQILLDKGFGGGDRFIESPEFKQQRVREARRTRRARRETKSAEV
ncbi:glycosyltransferase 61 family protein [Phaeobacter sp. QD34_3]|uniref:glycosyltransferase family 61 protein n=1 Tax=unclassified Phaeobacter TaxID=2621772 RepID=UPI00237F488C|nr:MULTISPECIES: glycosyltransferase 61 family protein [unclassified Phaeobacter]MDE4134921.1 glycosyltransferase 61 family protein [Phaeobacter sp. QD34_3]MDE4138551.1 glycosyltransferase 61 family protein [Phaeobacter sp. QD34_24]